MLNVLHLNEKERQAYERYQDDLHQRASMVASHYGRGVAKAPKKGSKRGVKRLRGRSPNGSFVTSKTCARSRR